MPFYVYGIKDIDGSYFYIGKGSKNRKRETLLLPSNNPLKKNKINKIIKITGQKPEVKILCIGFEDYCFNIEKKLIKFYGRRDLNTGILTNMTDGGEGTSGIPREKRFWLGKKRSPECINKMRNKLIGRKPVWTGKSREESHSENWRKSNCKNIYKLTSLEGEVIHDISLRRFCKNYNISTKIYKFINTNKLYHGWKVEKI